MALLDCKGSLAKATKDLFMRWAEVKDVWSDMQSEEFEKTYLIPLEEDVKSALGAMESMGQVISRLESDCE